MCRKTDMFKSDGGVSNKIVDTVAEIRLSRVGADNYGDRSLNKRLSPGVILCEGRQ